MQPSQTMPEAFTDGFFTTADGPKIHYRDYAPVGAVTGVPVLCLHGLTRNVKDFEDLAPLLAGMGRRVIVASQRGRGLSDPDPVVERYHPLTYSIDMLGLLTELDIPKAVFVGTSMGGLMTMIIASQNPESLAGAVLNDIGPELAEAGLDRIKANTASREPVTRWEEAADRSKQVNLACFPNRENDDAFWLDFAQRCWGERADGKIALEYDGAIIDQLGKDGAPPDLWGLWDAFGPIPTLLVRGAITDLITPETVAEMTRRKPDLQVVEVAGVGHAPFMTEDDAWPGIKKFVSGLE